jgi:Type VI secretion system/phage-baseplate injector OB domain
MSDNMYYGIYRGVCQDNQDPENINRIKFTCSQVLHTNWSNWAHPVNPVTGNANHLDHLPHLASEVAALLNTHATHTISGTTGTGPSYPSGTHTHTFSATASHAAHSGNSGALTHAHVASTDSLDKDGSETGGTAAEHTYHREVPNIGQGVWVMFEGGDVNFPLWVGVF